MLKGDGVSTSDVQIKAIEALQSTLNKWSDDDTKKEKEPMKVKEQPGQVRQLPRVHRSSRSRTAQDPRVQRKPLGVLKPGSQPISHRTRASTTKQKPQIEELIANRTRSKTQSEDVITAVVQYLLACSLMDVDTGEMLEFRQLRRHPKYKNIWDTSYANELGRLCQGIGKYSTMPTIQRIKGTDTFRVMKYEDIPKERRSDVCHTSGVCEVRPDKDYPNRTRITVAGNRICYPGYVSTPQEV